MNMTKPICRFVAVLIVSVCISFHGVSSLSINKLVASRTQQPMIKTISLPPSFVTNEELSPVSILDKQELTSAGSSKVVGNNNLKQALLAGCITFLTTTPLSAFAESADDLEIVDLPPPYVPILFAIGVLGGVGVLTASLGNVMDEEASLGLQSGARAKKERDRSRSSYFKK